MKGEYKHCHVILTSQAASARDDSTASKQEWGISACNMSISGSFFGVTNRNDIEGMFIVCNMYCLGDIITKLGESLILLL